MPPLRPVSKPSRELGHRDFVIVQAPLGVPTASAPRTRDSADWQSMSPMIDIAFTHFVTLLLLHNTGDYGGFASSLWHRPG